MRPKLLPFFPARRAARRVFSFAVGAVAMACSAHRAPAQDDLLDLAMKQLPDKPEKTIATFKTTKLVNAHTNETLHGRTLDFRVGHRFGNVGQESHGGIHTFYGLDASTDIRIAFEYGVTDRLMCGVSRSKRNENYEGLLKFRLLEQTTGRGMPLAVTLFANTALSGVRAPDGLFPKTTDRLSYTFQAIVARKFSDRISVMLLPTLVHRNYIYGHLNDIAVSADDNKNDLYALGIGGRFRFTKSASVVIDYFHNFDRFRKPGNEYGFYQPLGAGVEIETGGHVFTVTFTNAQGIIENDYIPNTTDDWGSGGFKFNFTISRIFRI
jgi:hypothetical protein